MTWDGGVALLSWGGTRTVVLVSGVRGRRNGWFKENRSG